MKTLTNVKTLTSKQRSLLFALCDNHSLSSEFIEALGISESEVLFLVNNRLIARTVEHNRYRLTKKGLESIDKQHTVVYSMGKSYLEVFNTASTSAANKIISDVIDSELLRKVDIDVQAELITSFTKDMLESMGREHKNLLIEHIISDIYPKHINIKQLKLTMMNAVVNRLDDYTDSTHKASILYNLPLMSLEDLFNVYSNL